MRTLSFVLRTVYCRLCCLLKCALYQADDSKIAGQLSEVKKSLRAALDTAIEVTHSSLVLPLARVLLPLFFFSFLFSIFYSCMEHASFFPLFSFFDFSVAASFFFCILFLSLLCFVLFCFVFVSSSSFFFFFFFGGGGGSCSCDAGVGCSCSLICLFSFAHAVLCYALTRSYLGRR